MHFMCMSVLPACRYAHHIHGWQLRRAVMSSYTVPALGNLPLKKKIQTVGSSALLKPQSLGLASQAEHIFLVEDHLKGVNVAVLLSHLLSTYYLLGSTCYAIVQNR